MRQGTDIVRMEEPASAKVVEDLGCFATDREEVGKQLVVELKKDNL